MIVRDIICSCKTSSFHNFVSMLFSLSSTRTRQELKMRQVFWVSIISLLVMSHSALTNQAKADDLVAQTSGVGTKSNHKNPPPSRRINQEMNKGTLRLRSGWNTLTCDNVWTYRDGKYTFVEIINTDESYIWSSVKGYYLNAVQEMMIRACRDSGSQYGIYVTDSSTGAWTNISGY